MLRPHDGLSVNDESVAAKVIDGEAIIMNLSSGMYYSMDKVGAHVWSLIEEARTLADIASTISGRYGVSREMAEADLERLVSELLAENLVRVVDGNGQPHSRSAVIEPAMHPYEAPVLQTHRDMVELLAIDPPMPELRTMPWRGPDPA
jgi:hypothetical protein